LWYIGDLRHARAIDWNKVCELEAGLQMLQSLVFAKGMEEAISPCSTCKALSVPYE